MNCLCSNSQNCLELSCGVSCPLYAQFSYLLERNEILVNRRCEIMPKSQSDKYLKILDSLDKSITSFERDPIGSIISKGSTINIANELTYSAVWTNWRGSQLHCTVYNLNFSKYIDLTKQSWSRDNSSEEADYIKIWTENAKVLVISGFDFVYFKQFQSEIFLSIVQSRLQKRLVTIIVSPPVSSLAGEGPFFAKICDLIKTNKVG